MDLLLQKAEDIQSLTKKIYHEQNNSNLDDYLTIEDMSRSF